MQYTIYQIKNNVNGKIYIGCHKTDDINDGYMGSGKILLRAYKKYGEENFTKEFLHIFDTSEEMFDREIELVNESFVEREDTYNIKEGGFGGFDYINKAVVDGTIKRNPSPGRIAANKVMRQKYGKNWRTVISKKGWEDEPRNNRKKSLAAYYNNGGIGSFAGKQHTQETKDVLSAKAKERLKDPTKNSQYGTCWIHNGRVSKKIEKDDLNEYLTEGWIKGRKMKFN